MIDAAAEWAVRTGPPNWVFILALLTSPSQWSRRVLQLVRKRLGWSE